MKTRILIIDDEPDVTHWLKGSLETSGYYEVCEENDALAAVATARAFDPDLVLLDVMMPDIDGSEVARRFAEDPVLRGVPVLFLTALVSEREARGGSCSSGGRVFLPKSISIDRLIACMNEHLRAPVALTA